MSRFGSRRIPALMRRPPGVSASGGAAALPTTDLLVSLFADQGVTDDGAGEVTAWADQSGSGNDTTQTSTTDRPEIDATGGPEGGVALAFGAQSADTSGCLDWASAVTSVASPHTYYIVCNPASTGGIYELIDFESGREICYAERAGSVQMYDGSAFRSFGAPATGWQVLTFQAATTASRAFRGRSQLGTDQGWAGDLALDGGGGLGARSTSTNSFDGRMAAVLIYDTEHDADQRAAVWDYLASRYPSVGL